MDTKVIQPSTIEPETPDMSDPASGDLISKLRSLTSEAVNVARSKEAEAAALAEAKAEAATKAENSAREWLLRHEREQANIILSELLKKAEAAAAEGKSEVVVMRIDRHMPNDASPDQLVGIPRLVYDECEKLGFITSLRQKVSKLSNSNYYYITAGW